jgi:hypothetical protein
MDPCPVCGYALSMVDHHCRHCVVASPTTSSRRFLTKHVQQIIVAAVTLSVLIYLIFFR